MTKANLTRWELTNTDGIGQFDTPQGVFKLNEITDEIADKIGPSNPHYFKKVEAPTTVTPAKAK